MSNVSSSSDAAYYQKAYDDYISGQEERAKERDQAQAREIDRIQDQNQAARLDQEEEHRKAIGEVRKNAQDVVSWNRSIDSDRIRKLEDDKRQIYNRYAQYANGQEVSTLEKQLKEAQEAEQARNEKYEKDLAAMRANQSLRMQEIDTENEDLTRALRQSHAEETSGLRSKLKDLTRVEKDSTERRAAQEAQETREREGDWLLKRRALVDAYEDQISKLKNDQETHDRTTQEKQRETLLDKEAYYAELMRRANQEAYLQRQGLENTYKTMFRKQEDEAKLDKERMEESASRRIASLNETQVKALNEQAGAYQDSFSRAQLSSKDEIALLQGELHRQRTLENPTVISPAAENFIRNSMTRHYEKQLEAEKERNKDALDHAVRGYKNDVQDIRREQDMKASLVSQENAAREAQDRNLFLTHTRDSEMMKDAALRNQQQDHDRELDQVNNKYEVMLERTRKEYEGIIETQRLNAMDKLMSQRQASDYQAKMAAREFAIRQTETARENDKKMNEMRQRYELQIDDLKAEMRKAVAEEQRRAKADSDELARGYEFRMKQAEQQNEDRERRVTQSYEDEIEKLKRSHALQLQKKG